MAILWHYGTMVPFFVTNTSSMSLFVYLIHIDVASKASKIKYKAYKVLVQVVRISSEGGGVRVKTEANPKGISLVQKSVQTMDFLENERIFVRGVRMTLGQIFKILEECLFESKVFTANDRP